MTLLLIPNRYIEEESRQYYLANKVHYWVQIIHFYFPGLLILKLELLLAYPTHTGRVASPPPTLSSHASVGVVLQLARTQLKSHLISVDQPRFS